MKRLAILLLALPMAVNAEPLIYDESVDGDLDYRDQLQLGFGENTVSGTVYYIPGEGYDFDHFDAFLPDFSILNSISLIQTDAYGAGRFPSCFDASVEPYHATDIADDYEARAGEFVWTYGKLTTFIRWIGHNCLPPGMEVDYTLVFDVSRTAFPAALALPGDINGDGSQDIAALLKDVNTLNAIVKDAGDRHRVSKVRFNPRPTPLDLEVMADFSGNGAPEFAVLYQDVRATNRATAEVRDSLSGELIGLADYGYNSPIDLELVPDQTGNGIPELAMLDAYSYSPDVTVKDPRTGNTVNKLYFGRFHPKDLSVWTIGEAVAVGVLGESRYSDRSDRIEVRDLETGEVINRVWLGKPWNLLQMELLGDLNGNGSPEAAILREHPEDGRVSVLPVDTANGARYRSLGFDPNYRPVRLRVLDDVNGNGSDEVAVLAVRRGSGNQKVWVKDAWTGQSINIVYFGKQFIGEDLAISPDMNGNGSPELVVLGRRDDGALRAIIKDSRTGELIGSVGF